jgi:hypothetical protein
MKIFEKGLTMASFQNRTAGSPWIALWRANKSRPTFLILAGYGKFYCQEHRCIRRKAASGRMDIPL